MKKAKTNLKGVIYARYSSDNQREESIEGQIRECKEYAEREGIPS
jgi:predicted site-specific integrase-resolvase